MVEIMKHGLWLLSLAGISTAGPAYNTTLYNRFTEIPVDGNGTQLVDLEAEPQTELLDGSDNNIYLLYTRQNSEVSQTLSIDEDSILSSNFDSNLPTAVLIHGWHSQLNVGLVPLAKEALLENMNTNVIVVDWRSISSLSYVTASAGVPSVGMYVGQFLEHLNALTGAPFSSMHLIGHSLGAHVSGYAGRELGGSVARVTGLDPAGPLFNLNPNRLKSSDAVYVEAIHTNSGGAGTYQLVGDVDFFPNGGSHQPGCQTPSCDHSRSYELYAASVTNDNLIGKKCTSLIQMTLDLCTGSELPLGNDDLQKSGSGIYRLNTSDTYPY